MTVMAVIVNTGAEPGTPKQAHVLVWVVAAVAWGIYFAFIIARHSFLSQFTIQTRQGILVSPGGYTSHIPSNLFSTLTGEVDRMIELYKGAGFPAGKLLQPRRTFFHDDGHVFVYFKPGPIEVSDRTAKVMGFVRAGGNQAVVAYLHSDDPPDRTALAHELGHIVIGRHTGVWDETIHHSTMKEKHIP